VNRDETLFLQGGKHEVENTVRKPPLCFEPHYELAKYFQSLIVKL